MHSQSLAVAAAITEAAKAIHSPRSLEQTLDAIVVAARANVPGFDHVGVTVSHPDGKVETLAGTDEFVWKLDEMQYELGEGPCLTAIIDHGPVVVVEDARHEQRWPQYIPSAVEAGLRAQMGLRLYTEDGTLGGLNLYSTQSEGVDPDAIQIAELFATHAALALGRARYEHQLNEALASRKTIGQAIGIVMERYRINEDRAFHFLVRASSTSNTKLHRVAEELVETTERQYADRSE